MPDMGPSKRYRIVYGEDGRPFSICRSCGSIRAGNRRAHEGAQAREKCRYCGNAWTRTPAPEPKPPRTPLLVWTDVCKPYIRCTCGRIHHVVQVNGEVSHRHVCHHCGKSIRYTDKQRADIAMHSALNGEMHKRTTTRGIRVASLAVIDPQCATAAPVPGDDGKWFVYCAACGTLHPMGTKGTGFSSSAVNVTCRDCGGGLRATPPSPDPSIQVDCPGFLWTDVGRLLFICRCGCVHDTLRMRQMGGYRHRFRCRSCRTLYWLTSAERAVLVEYAAATSGGGRVSRQKLAEASRRIQAQMMSMA